MEKEGRFPIFSEIELGNLPRVGQVQGWGLFWNSFPILDFSISNNFPRTIQSPQKVSAAKSIRLLPEEKGQNSSFEIDHKFFCPQPKIFFSQPGNPKNLSPTHHQKTSPLPNLPWTFCSRQKIRGRLQRSQKDLSSRFLFFGLQSLLLNHPKPLSRYIRNFFSHQKTSPKPTIKKPLPYQTYHGIFVASRILGLMRTAGEKF
jgi:hypothetical protein